MGLSTQFDGIRTKQRTEGICPLTPDTQLWLAANPIVNIFTPDPRVNSWSGCARLLGHRLIPGQISTARRKALIQLLACIETTFNRWKPGWLLWSNLVKEIESHGLILRGKGTMERSISSSALTHGAPGKSPLADLSPVHQAEWDLCWTVTSPDTLPVTVKLRCGVDWTSVTGNGLSPLALPNGKALSAKTIYRALRDRVLTQIHLSASFFQSATLHWL